jgi:subtilisin family serine protease
MPQNNPQQDTEDDAMLHAHSKPLTTIGADRAALDHCLTGANVKVAILDSGVDCTHVSVRGEGTVEAFQAAFGTNLQDVRNTRRDGLFPTERLHQGCDFVGDTFHDGDPDAAARPDHDPIDLSGHGTAVAHAARAVAPNATLVAVKICSTNGRSTCPDFACLQGLKQVLDPNQDGYLDDAVDIVN